MRKFVLFIVCFLIGFGASTAIVTLTQTQPQEEHLTLAPLPVAKTDVPLFAIHTGELNEKQSKILTRIKDQKTTISTIVVRINKDALGKTPLGVQLDEHTKLVLYKYENIAEQDPIEKQVDPNTKSMVNHLHWKAGTDSVLLVVLNESATGLIYSDNKVFSVEPLGDGFHAISQIDQSKFPKDR